MLKPKNNDSETNKLLEMVKSNPCGVCRALGMPKCRGGHGGGSEDRNEDEDNNELMEADKPSLELILNKSNGWKESPDEDLQYQFSNSFSLLSMRLDLTKGKLTCSGKESLTKDEQEELDALYEAIRELFEQFQKELAADGKVLNATFQMQANQLTIQIQPPQYFDAFIAQLMTNNLLPTTQVKAPLTAVKDKAVPEKDEEQTVSGYKSPSPFDIASGPRSIESY